MSQRFSTEWAFTADSDRPRRCEPLASDARWEQLSQSDRDNFLDQADWSEIRRLERAGGPRPGHLVSLDGLCQHLQLSEVETYALMLNDGLPRGFLFLGRWIYNLRATARLVQALGGSAAVRQAVRLLR